MLISMNILRQKDGVSALITIIMIAAIGLTLGLSINGLGLNELLAGYNVQRSEEVFRLGEVCFEEAHYRLKRSNAYVGGTVSLGALGDCDITISGAGSTRTVSVTATKNDFTQTFDTDVTLQTNGAGNANGLDITHYLEN